MYTSNFDITQLLTVEVAAVSTRTNSAGRYHLVRSCGSRETL